MAKSKGFSFRKKRQAAPPDELGGFMDGGLAILDVEGNRVHVTPSKVAASLRYFLARVQLHDSDGLPSRLALTSALVGEGVTYITRSLAAVLAYDTLATVVVVDLNWRRPNGRAGGGRASGSPTPSRTTFPWTRSSSRPPTRASASCRPGAVPVARRPALASGTALAEALDELEERFDHLLLDLPPVLATSEAMNLSQFADSVRARRAPRRDVGGAGRSGARGDAGRRGARRHPQPLRQQHPEAHPPTRRHLIGRTA